jgi:DNA adenine methylase
MEIPHPFPYQGSKRGIAKVIMAYYPIKFERLIEPFAGAAAITLATAYYGRTNAFLLNDVNQALIDLWTEIIDNPEGLSDAYEKLWVDQKGRERVYYDYIREQFNSTHLPHFFLYLLARCVKAAIRYNSKGEFNQGPDNRRKGVNPHTMKKNIINASKLLKGRTCLKCSDYRDILAIATKEDVVYMDPPYQGVCNNKDPRYLCNVTFDTFVEELDQLNSKGMSYILSYDGRNGLKTYGRPLPESLELTRIEINAGRSTQATLLGRQAYTIESLYLSPSLIARTEGTKVSKLTSSTVTLDYYRDVNDSHGKAGVA